MFGAIPMENMDASDLVYISGNWGEMLSRCYVVLNIDNMQIFGTCDVQTNWKSSTKTEQDQVESEQ